MEKKKFTPKPLKEQTIVITGASSGIGLATALMAAKKGANVVLSSRNGEDLARIVKKIREDGGWAIAVTADVSRPEEMERLRDEAIRTFGGIDTWVNNAGASVYGLLADESLESERQVFETNFWGVRHGCRAAVSALSMNGGVIINLGSEASVRATPLLGIYSASKHAVKGYTEALRMELHKMNVPVEVSLIRPTAIDTPFTEHAKNELPWGEPSVPSPAYHPDVVANAILACAVKPRRDVYVGLGSRLTAIREFFMPARLDRQQEKSGFGPMTKGTRRSHTKDNEGLHGAPAEEGKLRGGHRGRVPRSSLYTSMSLHPLVSALVVSGLTSYLMKRLFSRPVAVE